MEFIGTEEIKEIFGGKLIQLDFSLPKSYKRTISWLIKKGYYDPSYDDMMREKREKNEQE
ncbi:MAG: hypothetical protein ACRCUS_05320 [Anaerovoracaceae bacterium]